MSPSQKIIKTSKINELAVNLSFFSSFYPKYYFLETTLKERLYGSIKRELGQNWFTEQINSMNQPTVFKAEIENIMRRKPKGFILHDAGFLVESGLGIWVEFFNRENYKMLKGVPILIFTKLPKDIKRKQLYQKLSSVKELRNQLFHYRVPPITQIDQLRNILDINNDLVNLLTWLGISKKYFESENFKKEISVMKKLLKA
jgi:uncharacterized protein YutE (UPF0331/DUF86 family)